MNKQILFFLLLCSISAFAQKQKHPKLWYNSPANASVKDINDGWKNDEEWLKALPVGNGFIGAMVFGDVNKERIQLNDKTLWSGSPADNDNPDAYASLQKIRELLFAGKYKEATELTNKTQVCKGVGSGNGNGANVPFGCYQTLGDLWFDFHTSSPYKNYRRELDLINGIAFVTYEQNGIVYTREVFASYPDKALIVHLKASKPGAISFSLNVNRPERFTTIAEKHRLMMKGVMNNGRGGDGIHYKVLVSPVIKGGSIAEKDGGLQISNSNEVTIVITSGTDYRLHYPDYKNENYEQQLDKRTTMAVAKSYTLLRQRQVADFSSFMNRVTFKLGNDEDDAVPTDKLLQKNKETNGEQYLYTLYFQFGRYLLISSSREGSLPANLQGIWANKIQTPWNCDYHTDVNVQMNYWPVEVTNLSECHLQLTNLITSVAEPGKKTAAIQYHARGWVIHPITNVWGFTAPGEHPSWGLHVGACAWLSQHLWEHYAFSLDKKYLQKVFPVLQEACTFYLDWLVKDPETGKLVSGPAASPENSFVAPDGSIASISMGPTHDQEVIYNLFTNTLLAAKELNIQNDIINNVTAALSQLQPLKIGNDGRLMEWAKEFKETEPTHRHVSHLFALYPGSQISYYETPDLAQAAKKSLEVRGDDGTGWSLAMKIGFWTRLHDGDHALKLLNRLLYPVHSSGVNMSNGGGTYNNLFCAHPPFQIDGNFGATAGIAEMLLQSQERFIELLPALPSTWKTGSVKGLCARGGYTLDISWKDGKLTSVVLHSKSGNECEVKYRDKKIKIQTVGGKRYDITNRLK